MPERQSQLIELERLLQQAGIIDENSQRLVEELQDHYFDLCAEARNSGCSVRRARDLAWQTIGTPADIASVAVQHRELLSVTKRFPLIASLANGFVSAAGAPAIPVFYCAQRRDSIARWSASVGLAVLLTAGLLLSLQSVLGII